MGRRARARAARWNDDAQVILPQAIRRMIPPFVNQSITQLKNTSLVSTIAVPDLLYKGTLITADTYRPLEVYTVIALIYFAMLFPMHAAGAGIRAAFGEGTVAQCCRPLHRPRRAARRDRARPDHGAVGPGGSVRSTARRVA